MSQPPEIVGWAEFRTHLLVPHELVAAITNDRPSVAALTVERGIYRWEGRPLLKVVKTGAYPRTSVEVTALEDVWLQEPGLTVRVEGSSVWRGLGPRGKWTTDPFTLEHADDAYRSTVHFPNDPDSPLFTIGVQLRTRSGRWRITGTRGFAHLLESNRPRPVPWQRCSAMGRMWEVAGTCPNRSQRSLKRLELAGHRELTPFQAWMHWLGWTGGAGAIVNAEGRTPPPGDSAWLNPDGKGFDLLWDPPSWRLLPEGRSISQRLVSRRARLASPWVPPR